jgi:hypothetical protein
MNAINMRGLVVVLVAGLATGAASAMDAASVDAHRAEKQERQEQRQVHQTQQAPQNRGQGNHYANNPPPPAPGGQHPPANRGNGEHLVVGPPRGPQGPNYHGPGANIVPPPRYVNQPGHGYPPGNNHGPGNGYPPGYNHGPGYGRPPYYVPSLPAGYHRHYWNGYPYYYGGGHWYRPYGSSYIVVGAPYGLFVSSLPYYSSFWYGSTRYYYSDGAYYNYDPVRSGYVVTPSPYGDENKDEVAAADDMYIYPAQGQSDQQQADDKYACHRWAVDQTQYDPTSSEFDAQRRADYVRAMTACLTGRGYTVR